MDSSSRFTSAELPCVGKLEIASPKPVVFLCGTLPVIADEDFSMSKSALIPSSQTIEAPRYQMLPTETDLNTLPLLHNIHEKVFFQSDLKRDGATHRESGNINPNISKKCEALAVYGLSEYGDEIDVVAPTDILKQIFKIPYSKARLSVTVHRIGNTLILNTGPDSEEGEKVFRRQTNQPRGGDSSIFLNFAMHSVRAEACDCPPSFYASSENQSSSTVLPEVYGGTFVTSSGLKSVNSQFLDQNSSSSQEDRLNDCANYSPENQDRYVWGHKKHKVKEHDSVFTTSKMREKSTCSISESEKYKRIDNNDFLRVLFWQFHNFRMLLGSDLLMFSNEKYVAVSLHLWDVARQVTPLSWLEAWLDNVMAGVPELAVCYHRNGVVQGYELLKTDDIFLLKGLSEDGIPAFHPQVVQQNGLSVLSFLQKNCKQDPGAYWLYKSAGEDVIQLFDLRVLPKSNTTDEHSITCDSLSSLMHKGRNDSLFSLGSLLYRVAHRLSLSKALENKVKCAKFFKKCLDFLGEQDHLVVRAYAHEQFARLILRCYQELDFTSESFLLEYEATITDVDDESSVFSTGMFGLSTQDKCPLPSDPDIPSVEEESFYQRMTLEEPQVLNLEGDSNVAKNIVFAEDVRNTLGIISKVSPENELAVCQLSSSLPQVQTVTDPISSKLAAIHHVSQAIKSLRWNRQLQNPGDDLPQQGGSRTQVRYPPPNLSLCACGDSECIEVCDIREWLSKAKMDKKLWKLVLLLGESYLALGEAYKENRELRRALRVVEIACSVYGSMPQYLDNDLFVSSMVSCSSSNMKVNGVNNKSIGKDAGKEPLLFSSNYLFWTKAWTIVGDVYVEYHRSRGNDAFTHDKNGKSGNELRMSNEVVREVTRLKKKLGRYRVNCSACSLMNCSCQSDRTSSGYSASSSGSDAHSLQYSRKQTQRKSMKNSPHTHIGTSAIVHDSEVSGIYDLKKMNISNQMHALASNPENLKTKYQTEECRVKRQNTLSGEAVGSEPSRENASFTKSGGIFRFLEGPKDENFEFNLAAAMECYNMARKSLGSHVDSLEIGSVTRKKGWVSNELGRLRLNNGEIERAELAFKDAIKAFKKVSDHTNIILINCNMGHGRRAVAEEMVLKIEKIKNNSLLKNVCKQSLKKAKLEYINSLKYYQDAKTELITSAVADLLLRNELFTQYANTYLRLGMLLAREDCSELDGSKEQEWGLSMGHVHMNNMELNDQVDFVNKKDNESQSDISANDAFREALATYESLGDLRKQEVAFAHFQLACYHKTSCLKFLDLDTRQPKLAKSENINRQKAKWYASLAERHWQKAIGFYCPQTHPNMFLDIVVEQSALSLNLSGPLHSNVILGSALSRLLEARLVVRETSEGSPCSLDPGVQDKIWKSLRSLLKKMVATAISASSNKSRTGSQPLNANKLEDTAKLKELYRMSLVSNDMSQLNAMYKLWIS